MLVLGTCFVFRLNGPKAKVYKWALEGHSMLSKAQLEDAILNEFAVCNVEYILMGGDASHGTNALYLDADLKTCISARSDTYKNPPLVTAAVDCYHINYLLICSLWSVGGGD